MMKNCTGILCPMQYDKVNPATCQAVDYCPQATPPKSNADKLRAMSDEELADFMTDDFCELLCKSPTVCDGQCNLKLLQWLKQEADENHAPICKLCGGTLSEIRYHNGRPYRHCYACHFEFYEEAEDGKAD